MMIMMQRMRMQRMRMQQMRMQRMRMQRMRMQRITWESEILGQCFNVVVDNKGLKRMLHLKQTEKG